MQYADPNSIPGDLLAFLMSQSQSARHNNAVSFISNPAISMSKVEYSSVQIMLICYLIYVFFACGHMLITS